MSKEQVAACIQVEATIAMLNAQAMIAENQHRKMLDSAQAYGANSFFSLADELSEKLEKFKQDISNE